MGPPEFVSAGQDGTEPLEYKERVEISLRMVPFFRGNGRRVQTGGKHMLTKQIVDHSFFAFLNV